MTLLFATGLRRVAAAIGVLWAAGAINGAAIAASDRVFWRGNGWTVAFVPDDGETHYCYVYKNVSAEVLFAFWLTRDATWHASIVDPRGQAGEKLEPFTLYVDGQAVVQGSAELVAAGGLSLGNLSSQSIATIIGGRVLGVSTQDFGALRVSLLGLRDAIDALKFCLANKFAVEQQGNGLAFRGAHAGSDGVLNLRAEPDSSSVLVTAIPVEFGGIEPLGVCKPDLPRESAATWCQFKWHSYRGWLVMKDLTEETAVSQSATASAAVRKSSANYTNLSRADVVSTGTAFFVSSSGHLLTNAHVVDACKTIAISQPGTIGETPATVLSRDIANDLALIYAPAVTVRTLPALRRRVRLGEDVAVFGYPLSGLIASTGNFTRGSVTALAGLQDDTTRMQLAAPVQPGNSGGPVLDQSGNVVGIIVGKLDAVKVAKVTGNIPEQINFAVKANTAFGFLDANNIIAEEASQNSPVLSPPDIAQRAKKYTVLVTCQN